MGPKELPFVLNCTDAGEGLFEALGFLEDSWNVKHKFETVDDWTMNIVLKAAPNSGIPEYAVGLVVDSKVLDTTFPKGSYEENHSEYWGPGFNDFHAEEKDDD